MKSVVLLVWLIATGERDRLILNHHFDDRAACESRAVDMLRAEQARGRQIRYLCHEVVPEVGGVDENGNPL